MGRAPRPTTNETLSLFVDETGDLRALETQGVLPTARPSFGGGAVLVSAGNRLDGAYDSGRPTSTFAEHCEFTGNASERVSMSITLACTDDSGTSRVPGAAASPGAHGQWPLRLRLPAWSPPSD